MDIKQKHKAFLKELKDLLNKHQVDLCISGDFSEFDGGFSELTLDLVSDGEFTEIIEIDDSGDFPKYLCLTDSFME